MMITRFTKIKTFQISNSNFSVSVGEVRGGYYGRNQPSQPLKMFDLSYVCVENLSERIGTVNHKSIGISNTIRVAIQNISSLFSFFNYAKNTIIIQEIIVRLTQNSAVLRRLKILPDHGSKRIISKYPVEIRQKPINCFYNWSFFCFISGNVPGDET